MSRFEAEELAREIALRVAERVEKDALEFATFLVALRLDDPDLIREGRLEPLRAKAKRLVCAALREQWKGERETDFTRPEARFLYDANARTLEVDLAAVHVYGRYTKLARDLPQTRWHCRACRGAGCAVCGGTGRTHEESVEDLLGGPLAESFRAARAVLHGMGREDVDARTLGRGRPFVVELSEPRSRKVDLAAAARATSERSRERVAVSPLRVVPAEVVARLKALDPPKRYRALVKVGAPVEPERVHALEGTFRGAEIRQRTPERVLRRRADKVRPRRVLELRAALLPGGALELLVVAEAGTYVKELVSGDSGRTAPSVAEALGVAASVVELDVLEILVEDEEVLGAPRASDRRE